MTLSSTGRNVHAIMSLSIAWTAFALSWLLMVPVLAGAQSTIAGEARDATGAVLPGVTVEAASDALIEKIRTANDRQVGHILDWATRVGGRSSRTSRSSTSCFRGSRSPVAGSAAMT